MKRHGYTIDAYTVNTPQQARRLQPYVDGIITDFPDRFTTESYARHI
jgi:glycerophosphoryl diester phosphodiesterase